MRRNAIARTLIMPGFLLSLANRVGRPHAGHPFRFAPGASRKDTGTVFGRAGAAGLRRVVISIYDLLVDDEVMGEGGETRPHPPLRDTCTPSGPRAPARRGETACGAPQVRCR